MEAGVHLHWRAILELVHKNTTKTEEPFSMVAIDRFTTRPLSFIFIANVQ